jgi:integrase
LGGESIPITDPNKEMCVSKAELAKAKHKISGRKKAKPKCELTLKEACTEYITNRKNLRRSPTTIQGYEKIRDTSFDCIMNKKVAKLTRSDIEKALEIECTRPSRYGEPLAPKTIKNNYSFIASVIKKHRDDLNIEISLPEIKDFVPTIIPPEKIFPIICGTEIELPCLLAMWLSLSMSEIRGLTKSKSIINGQIIISETVVDVKGKATKKAGGKEEKRTRAFDIPPYINDLINAVKTDALVTLSGQAIYKRFSRLLEKNGLPHISFHRLRHISASVGSALNIPTKEMQERGGWKTDYTMKRVYMHTFTENRKLADAKIDNYFNSIITKAGG